jgi:hypothetical protein
MREARACVIKYFREDSEEKIFFLSDIIGIIDKRLISKPIHIVSHEYEEIAIKVPRIIEFIKMILCNFIKKRKD